MKYILEKYKGQTTRFTCPKCGRKHSFTRYIDSETGRYLSPLVGICNRAIKCGYHFPPKQFFENNLSVHRFSQINTNELEEKEIRENSCKSVDKKKEITPIKQIDKKYLQKTFGKESNFLTFLKNTFPNDVVEQVILDYFISGTKDKSIIYWQIDLQGRIRTGKIMQYNPETGHRIKSPTVIVGAGSKPALKRTPNNKTNQFSGAGLEPAPTGYRITNQLPISWIHSELKRKGILPMDWQLTQCLFGEHLITKYPQKPIMLVESEKTAIVMSCFHPCFNWLATGGLQNLKMEKLYPIRKFPIIAYPDLKCYDLWKAKAEKINKEIGSQIVVSHYLEELANEEQKEQGLDIADFYLMING